MITRYTEPLILALIVVNAVALVGQASRILLLPSTQVPTTVRGYFHNWEDFFCPLHTIHIYVVPNGLRPS